MRRRSLLVGMIGAAVGAAQGAPSGVYLHGDGAHDDTEALRRLFGGEVVQSASGPICIRDNVIRLPAGVYAYSIKAS